MSISLEGISLHVSDIQKSKEFYARIPGAELVAERPGVFARYQIGKGSLHLVQIKTSKAFHMEMDTDDIAATHAQLCANGLDPSAPQRHPWGKTDFKVLDPDGNILEIGLFEGAAGNEVAQA
jgi:catechol 2,3-dioxygenase-like lactoylglutathione lyase family enzyme